MLRVRTQWGGTFGQDGLSTHYFDAVAATSVIAQAAVDRVRDMWTLLNTNIAAGVSWTVQGTVDVIETNGELTDSVGVTSRTGSGSNIGDVLPTQTQGEIAWLTNVFVAGRRVKGRTYVPAPTETISTGGSPLAAYSTALTTAAAGMPSAVEPIFGIWSKKNSLFAPVISGTGQGQWKVLRSRR